MCFFISKHRSLLFVASVISIFSDKPATVLGILDHNLPIDLELEESMQSTSTTTSNSMLDSSTFDPRDTDDHEEKDSILLEEFSETGSLEFSVYASYWKAIGHFLCLSILFSVALMQFSRNMTDWWLAHWVTNAGNSSNSTNRTMYDQKDPVLLSTLTVEEYDMTSYLKVYIEFACMNTIFTLIRAFIFAYGGVMAATKFHKLLLKSVMKVNFLALSSVIR